MYFEEGIRTFTTSIGAIVTYHDLIQVSGSGAKSFLQGQLSADMDELDDKDDFEGTTKTCKSLLLSPEGKLEASLRVIRPALGVLRDYGGTEDSYFLECPVDFGKQALERLKRFSIGSNCEMVLKRCRGLAVLFNTNYKDSDTDSLEPYMPIFVHPKNPDEAVESRFAVWEEEWDLGYCCIHLVGVDPDSELAYRRGTKAESMPLEFCDKQAFEAIRISCGISKMGAELVRGIIPNQAGKKIISESVSFTKGCFVGQELTARMDSRGAEPPMRIMGIKAQNMEAGEASDYGPLELNGEQVGHITSMAPGIKSGAIALAAIKRKVQPGTILELKKSGESYEAKVLDLPLDFELHNVS